jgi:hypothetical protein
VRPVLVHNRRFSQATSQQLGRPTNPCRTSTTIDPACPQGTLKELWFPEMIERLRSRWHHGMSFAALVELRDDLEMMLQRIRSDRHIRPAVFRCPKCGHVGAGAELHVSVRAMILSLTRFGIAPAEQIQALEKAWATHRKENGLDLYGVVSPVPDTGGCVGCVHPHTQ